VSFSCEVCFKRQADRNGVCNVCHGVANDASLRAAKTRIIEQTYITDEIVEPHQLVELHQLA
jgi:hypothetical protein